MMHLSLDLDPDLEHPTQDQDIDLIPDHDLDHDIDPDKDLDLSNLCFLIRPPYFDLPNDSIAEMDMFHVAQCRLSACL